MSSLWTSDTAQHLLTLMDNHLLQLPLGRGPLQDLLVDGVGCDQSIHHHWLSLSNAVTAVLCLQIRLRVLATGDKIRQNF